MTAGQMQVDRRFLQVTMKNLGIEEPQGGQSLRYGVRCQFPASEQRGLILANMLWAKPIGWTTEVAAEMLHRADVGADG